MLNPTLAEKTVPVLEDPQLDGLVPQVASFLLALDPFETLGLLLTIALQAHLSFGKSLKKLSAHRGKHRGLPARMQLQSLVSRGCDSIFRYIRSQGPSSSVPLTIFTQFQPGVLVLCSIFSDKLIHIA